MKYIVATIALAASVAHAEPVTYYQDGYTLTIDPAIPCSLFGKVVERPGLYRAVLAKGHDKIIGCFGVVEEQPALFFEAPGSKTDVIVFPVALPKLKDA